MRAFAYDLPAGFYDSPDGPNTTNLSILPNENFQSGGTGVTIAGGIATSIPYSMDTARSTIAGTTEHIS